MYSNTDAIITIIVWLGFTSSATTLKDLLSLRALVLGPHQIHQYNDNRVGTHDILRKSINSWSDVKLKIAVTSWYRNLLLTFVGAGLASSHSIKNLMRTGPFPWSDTIDVWDTFIWYFGSSATESRTSWPKGLFLLSSWTWVGWAEKRPRELGPHDFDACRRLLTKEIQCCDSVLSEYLMDGEY